MGKVFTNLDILREQPTDADFFNHHDEIARVRSRIQRACSNEQNTIIAYLGDYGMGKSQVLKVVEKSFDKNVYEWIHFESWQYSGRQDLWQYFTELVSLRLSGGIIKQWFKQHVLDLMVLALVLGSILLAFLLHDGLHDQWIISYIKYIASIVCTVVVGYFIARYIHPKTPLTRMEDFERTLRNSIRKSKKTPVIVIEDVDRTGDYGITFMESLSVFLKNNYFKKSVIVIAPQKNTILSPLTPEKNGIRPIENGVKIYDESIYFSVDIDSQAIKNFYKNLSFTRKYGTHKLAMEWITNELVYYHYSYQHNGQLSIRMMKYAIRSVEYFLEANPTYNPAIALVIILSGLIQNSSSPASPKSAFSNLKQTASVPGNNNWVPSDTNFWHLCMQVAIESDHTDREEFDNYIGTSDTGRIKNIGPRRKIKVFMDGTDNNGHALEEDFITTTSLNSVDTINIRIRKEYLSLVS